MKTLLIILSFLFTTSAYSQVGIGHSFAFWGKATNVAEVFYQYDRFSIHYFHYYGSTHLKIGYLNYRIKTTSSTALAVRVLQTKYFNFGGIASINKFPTYDATHLNFLLELSLPIKWFVISYAHVSNGSMFLGKPSQGYDSFLIKVKI